MPPTDITHRWQPAAPILTGHFHEGPRYGTTRPQGSGDHLLILTLSGAGQFQHQAAEFTTSTGVFTLYTPDAAQNYRCCPAAGSWELLWTHFQPRPHWTPWLHWPETFPGLRTLQPDDPAVTAAARDALAAMHEAWSLTPTQDPLRADRALHHLESALMHLHTANPNADNTPLDPRLRDALLALHRRLEHPWTIDTLARHAHLSPSRFAHLFTQQLGQSPMQYLDAQRMARARELLRLTAQPIAAIAAAVGIEDPVYFGRRFRQAVGQTPRQYRNASR
ncbi:MAG: helix-turn-helix domain-containing protein [Planctomycetota bacterium]